MLCGARISVPLRRCCGNVGRCSSEILGTVSRVKASCTLAWAGPCAWAGGPPSHGPGGLSCVVHQVCA